MRILISNFLRIALLVVLALAAISPAWAQNSDTILVNGKILTVDTQFSTREALAIHDGKITLVGSNSEVRSKRALRRV